LTTLIAIDLEIERRGNELNHLEGVGGNIYDEEETASFSDKCSGDVSRDEITRKQHATVFGAYLKQCRF
jgi:hypothetical protein